MITLISTPEYIEQVSPEIVCRWVATESPNNFRLLRHDFNIVTAVNNSGFLQLTVSAGTFTGLVGDVIAVFNKTLNAMSVGTVTAGSGTTTINTDIPFATGFDPSDPALDPDRTFTYINDNTLYAGFYFEGRLTVNGVINNLTIIASPDSFGYADLDVSGILRIATSIGKVTDYSALILPDTNKSGKFNLEFRSCWFGGCSSIDGSYVIPLTSPPVLQDWYYAEAVRSEEQGSNLHEYEADDLNCARFFNSFENPVYFVGLPFDLSFIMPERPLITPSAEITVQITFYNLSNLQLSQVTTTFPSTGLEGYVCSLNIDPASIPANASYFTAEITAP